MAFSPKDNLFFSYIQVLSFIIVVIFAQYKLFTAAFLIVMVIILAMIITSQKNRAFLWTTAAYLTGYLCYLYGDRFIDALSLSVNTRIILSRSLMLMPILLMIYVLYKFKVTLIQYWKRPNWQAVIWFPFITKGFHSVSIKLFLLSAIALNIIGFLPFISQTKIPFDFSFLLYILLFSVVNGILEEILWRGIILTRMADLVGEIKAIIFSGAAFGLSHLAFGYSLFICLAFAAGGFFYAGITVRSGSILPAAVWHIIFNILMILSGVIPFVR